MVVVAAVVSTSGCRRFPPHATRLIAVVAVILVVVVVVFLPMNEQLYGRMKRGPALGARQRIFIARVIRVMLHQIRARGKHAIAYLARMHDRNGGGCGRRDRDAWVNVAR